MKAVLSCLVLLLATAQTPAHGADQHPTRVNIFGVDRRIEVAQGAGSEYAPVGFLQVDLARPLCVAEAAGRGKIFPESRECFDGGTAFLVGPRHVLTTAHVAFRADPRRLGAGQRSSFRIGRNARATATPVAWGDYVPGRFMDNQDWAVLELDKPLGRSFGWIELRALPQSAAAQRRVASVGYPNDQPDYPYRLMVDPDCRIRPSPLLGEGWGTDCATRGGNSGSPVLYREGSRLYAIALISAMRGERSGIMPEWSGVWTNVAVPVTEILPRIQAIIGADRQAGMSPPRGGHSGQY